MKVPLAARHFLHTEGYCTTDQQLHNAGHSDSTQFQFLAEKEQGHGSADGEITLDSCSCTDGADHDSLKVIAESGERGEGDAMLPKRRVELNGRFDVLFEDRTKKKEWYPGTVMYIDGSGQGSGDCAEGILVYDEDGAVEYLSSKMLAEDESIRCSTVQAPSHKSSLLNAVLQNPTQWNWLIHKFMTQGKTGKNPNSKVDWTLQILAKLSKRIEKAKPEFLLEFTGKLLGKGGFGIVVETTRGAVKMEIAAGSRSFCEQALWRDYNCFVANVDSSTQSDACKNRRNVKQHLPRPLNLFSNMAFAQISENGSDGKTEYTISLLGMEKLDDLPQKILKSASEIFKHKKRVDESARLFAINLLIGLQRLQEAGIAHCDLKPEHLKWRAERNAEFQYPAGLVFIDGSCCRLRHNQSAVNVSFQQVNRANGKFVSAMSSVPKKNNISQVLPIIGDARRTGTHGYRVPAGAAEKSFEELLSNDVFSAGIILLSVVGLAPGLTRVEAEQFEQKLYECLGKACFSRFLELCPGYQAGKHDGGLDCTTIRWLRLCFEMLKLEHGNRITPAKALRSSMLLHPNYEEKLFEQLCGDGVVVFDKTGLEPVLKPLLLLYSPDHGILVYRLLNYEDGEQIGRYGGQLLAGDIGLAKYGLHNLSCSGDHVLCGAVSEFHSLESFILTCCVGSFFESSRSDPDTLKPGNCLNPDRLGATSRLDAPNQHGTSSIMTYIPMFSKRVPHSIRCSWCYSFNAGCGEHLLTQKELEEKQKSFKRPVPHHFRDAVQKQRKTVLARGFADSWTDSVESDLQLGSESHLSPVSEPEGQDCPPLPECVVRGLETASSMDYQRISWDEVMQKAAVLTENDQMAAGISVLPSIPTSRSEFAKAAQGQRVVMMDGTSKAIEAAKSLKKWTETDGDIYSRVCGLSPAEGQQKATGRRRAESERRGRKKAAKGQTEAEGGGGQERSASKREKSKKRKKGEQEQSEKEPQVPCILRVILAYCIGCSTQFSSIFQTFGDDTSGDGRRREMKGDKWKRPVMKSGESKEAFLDRMAGYRFLLAFYDVIFYAMANVLPKGAAVRTSLDRNKTSLLMSDARKGRVQHQEVHFDLAPSLQSIAYSVLMCLSELMSYIGLVLNSGPNVEAALQFENSEIGNISFNGDAHLGGHFRNRYLRTRSASNPEKLLSEVMSEKGFEEVDVLRHAWSLHLQSHTEGHPEQFKPMRGVWAQMKPFMLCAFDNRVLHCGPEFPMPCEIQVRLVRRVLLQCLQTKVHIRSGKSSLGIAPIGEWLRVNHSALLTTLTESGAFAAGRGHLYFFEDNIVESDSESESLYVPGAKDKAHENTCDVQDDMMAGVRPLLKTPGFE